MKQYIAIRDGVECSKCDGTGFVDEFDPDTGLINSIVKCTQSECNNGIVLGNEYFIAFETLNKSLNK